MPPDMKSSNKKTYNKDTNHISNKGKNIKLIFLKKMHSQSKSKRNLNRINYYITLSILIHLAMFSFLGSKKETTLGDKIVPIEIIDIDSIASKGEYFQKPQKRGEKDIKEIKKQEQEKKKKLQEKIIKEDKDINIKEESKIIKENTITPRYSGINKDRGNEGKLKSNEVEKGSLKGKGIEKITCLSCLKPEYPKLALKRGYEGIVKLKILISKNGEVVDVKIIKSSGYKILDQSGFTAAKKSRFYPLTRERSINIEYNLKLNR